MSNEKFIKSLRDHYEKHGIHTTSRITSLTIKEICELLDLNLKTFDDIKFIEELNNVRGRIMFDNGYGASVVSHNYSYGGNSGLYELAVLGKDGKLTYDTPITNDVVGCLSPEQVTEYLFRIQDLKN
jgi:hypothetical protein